MIYITDSQADHANSIDIHEDFSKEPSSMISLLKMIDFIQKISEELSEKEAIELAIKLQKNLIYDQKLRWISKAIRKSFGVTDSDSTPRFLEKIAMILEEKH